jgi:hypothetical protein
MKTQTLILEEIHRTDDFAELINSLRFKQFEKEHPNLDEDELSDKFYEKEISSRLLYGEIANLEIIFDENLNIVGGKFLPKPR